MFHYETPSLVRDKAKVTGIFTIPIHHPLYPFGIALRQRDWWEGRKAMLQQQRTNSRGEKYVVGPTGSPLTLSDLPPANTQRWVIRRKAEVVAAVRGGLLTLDEACERYSLTNEEFLAWQQSIDRHGLAGLRATRLQQYR